MKAVHFHFINLARHGVTISEAHQALIDGWGRRRRQGDNYEILGKSADGRHLQLVIEDRPDDIWVFHAREMTATERRRYERK